MSDEIEVAVPNKPRQKNQQHSKFAERAAACAASLKTLTGCDELTLLQLDADQQKARRIYTSAPEAFPLFGTKPLPKGRWTELIVEERIPALFTGTSEIRSTFPDHEKILNNGIQSVLNVPIVLNERCVGSINCLYKKKVSEHPSRNLTAVLMPTVLEYGLFDVWDA